MNKRILMTAYHYPPSAGSSGQLRTLCFARDLPAYGWDPIVLTASPRAYPKVTADQLDGIPGSVPMCRAFALDTARHLSLWGHYSRWSALPDRWVSWFAGAVPSGLALISKYRPKVIWSTYPIATAHLIGYALHRLTGIPWVADFRDPMTEVDPLTGTNHPPELDLWRVRRWIESQAIHLSIRAVFVTPGAYRLHAARYPDVPSERLAVIPNGYDESSFQEAEKLANPLTMNGRPVVLLHSGLLYPTPDRDPRAFFAALASLRSAGEISAGSVQIILRASGYEEQYRQQIQDLGIGDIVQLKGSLLYPQALAEMLCADGLLLFQGETSNPAIPAKFYEYLRARRPIFALVHAEGDTANALRTAGLGTIVPLVSSEEIAKGLLRFLQDVRGGRAPVASSEEIRKHSRKSRAEELARLLDEISV